MMNTTVNTILFLLLGAIGLWVGFTGDTLGFAVAVIGFSGAVSSEQYRNIMATLETLKK
jgi:hypothetical protein